MGGKIRDSKKLEEKSETKKEGGKEGKRRKRGENYIFAEAHDTTEMDTI